MKSSALAARELMGAFAGPRRVVGAGRARMSACSALAASAFAIVASSRAAAEVPAHDTRSADPRSADFRADVSRTGDAVAADVVRGQAALSIGRGLRFNNPYRLETPLGDTAESVSLSATYLDLNLAMLLAQPVLDHGLSLSALFALDGIGQFVITPSYLAQLAIGPRLAARGRLGTPIVIAPDATIGLEAALGANLLVVEGFGITSEAVASVFFGAATEEKAVTTIPMLSLQVGVIFQHGVF